MKSRDVHYWRRRRLVASLRRQQLLARNPVNRYRNRCGLDTAVPIMVRVTSPETARIPIYWFHPPPIRARFLICASLSRTLIRGWTSGGWTRQVTVRELGISKDIAGVDMRLNAGSVRELHWHKEAEWAYMLYGSARITAIDPQGHSFVDDVGVGDLWYFPRRRSAFDPGLNPDGCEFLLVFDDGDFDEDDTFLLSDWFKHTPNEVLSKNFGVPDSSFAHVPDPSELYIFPASVPGPLDADKIAGAIPVSPSFSHRMLAQQPIKTKSGTVRITDTSVFPASKTISAALVEVEPGGMREMHWHPNTNEWQYYIEGQARMGVFAASGQARTFDYHGRRCRLRAFRHGPLHRKHRHDAAALP